MIKKNNKITHSAVSIMLSVALAMTSVNVSGVDITKSVSAATVNPVDTGNGYEYSTGRAIGMNLGTNCVIAEDVSDVIFDEYNLSDCRYDGWGGSGPISIERKNMLDDTIITICILH